MKSDEFNQWTVPYAIVYTMREMTITDIPTLTVFTTLYNVAEYLPRFFQCMKKQTFSDYILLLIDDGSEDNTLKVCESYAKKDQRIRGEHIPHKGITAARNYAISLIGTPFAASADGDDIYGPDYLLHLMEAQKKYDADLVISRVAYCSEELRRSSVQEERGELLIRKNDYPDMLPVLLEDRRLNYLYAKLFRSHILKTTFVEEDVLQGSDTMFCCQYVTKADSIVLIDDLDTNYIRYSSRSVTSRRGADEFERYRRIQDTITNTFREAGFLNADMQRVIDGRVFESSLWALSSIAKADVSVREAEKRVQAIFKSRIYMEAYHRQKGNLAQFRFHVVDPGSVDYPDKDSRIIVSMTSFPYRISYVPKVLETIYAQTRKADEVILWLATEQFPDQMLPEELVNLEQEGKLTIRWCDDDLMSHKKYFYAFREFPDDLIITIDDDLYYRETLIENLFRSFLINPCAVSAARAHMMMFEEGEIVPYKDWLYEYSHKVGEASMLLFATSGAGTLFPAYLFNQGLLDKDVIIEKCLHADDIWLKMLQVEAGIPVVLAEPFSGLKIVPGTQEQTLLNYNWDHNDEQLRKCIDWFDEKYGKGFVLSQLGNPLGEKDIVDYYKEEIRKRDSVINRQKKEIETLRFDFNEAWNSVSMRIGRVVTWPGRTVRDLLKGTLSGCHQKNDV